MILMNMLKRLPIAFLLLVFAFFAFPNSSYAQEDIGDISICSTAESLAVIDESTCIGLVNMFSQENNTQDGPWYNQNFRQFAKKVTQAPEEEIFGERYTFAQINWIVNSIATMLNPASGIDSPTKLIEFFGSINNIFKSLSQSQQPSIQDYAKLGPAGIFAGSISMLYSSPPASAIQETKVLASKILDIGTTPVNAQGYGFQGLDSGGAIRALWTATRNMSYLLIVVLLVAAGFLIMFKVKINPQMAVSLQVMIPKLITTLILVTFSFAIAGLIIDLIYVIIIGFVGLLLFGGIADPVQYTSGIPFLVSGNFIMYFAAQLPLMITPLIIAGIMGLLGGLVGLLAGPGGALAIGGLFFMILAIGVTVHFMITLWKIFLMLLKAYITLVLQTIIAPLQIMLDLVPGQQGFGPWIRAYIANASVFAVVPIMLVLEYIFVGNMFGLIPIKDFPTLGGNNLTLPYSTLSFSNTGVDPIGSFIMRWLIGYGIFAMTPKIADAIREALKVPPFKYGTAIDEAFASIGKASQGYGTYRASQYIAGQPPGAPPDRLTSIIRGLSKRGVLGKTE
jgi:hypothetical protein